MPTSVWVVVPPPPPQAATASRNSATAANLGPFRAIENPPTLMNLYLNSLGVRRRLSSLSIARPAQPAVERDIAGRDQPDDAVAREHHDQYQDHAVADRGPGVLHRRRDLVGDPALAGHPLVRLDG